MAPSLDVVDWPVRTERLTLRRLSDADLPAIFAYRSQPQVAEWIGGLSADVESLAERLAERLGDGATVVIVEHNVADSLHRDHGWLDGYFYALLAEEWPRPV